MNECRSIFILPMRIAPQPAACLADSTTGWTALARTLVACSVAGLLCMGCADQTYHSAPLERTPVVLAPTEVVENQQDATVVAGVPE